MMHIFPPSHPCRFETICQSFPMTADRGICGQKPPGSLPALPARNRLRATLSVLIKSPPPHPHRLILRLCTQFSETPVPKESPSVVAPSAPQPEPLRSPLHFWGPSDSFGALLPMAHSCGFLHRRPLAARSALPSRSVSRKCRGASDWPG